MSLIPRREHTATLLSPTEMFHRLFDTECADNWMRIEELQDEGSYVVRAEIPEIDPEKDVQVTVDGGALRIHAERRPDVQAPKDNLHSEFRYGAFDRVVTLPDAIDPDKVEATYAGGVLTVRFPLPPETTQGEPRRIPVTAA